MACNNSNRPVNNNAAPQQNVEKIEVPELVEKNVVATEHDIKQAALTTAVQGVVGVLCDIRENMKDMQQQGKEMKEEVHDVREEIRLMKESQKRAAVGRGLKFAFFTSLLALFCLGVMLKEINDENSALQEEKKNVEKERDYFRQQMKDCELSERGWIFAFFVVLLVAVFSGRLPVSMNWENSNLKKRI